MPGSHSAVIGGSSASKRLNCPGSLALEAKFHNPAGGEESSVFAEVGTALHQVMEDYFSDLDLMRSKTIGEYAEGRTVEGVLITKEMVASKLEPALECLKEIEKSHGCFVGLEFEARCKFPGVENAFGTVDLIAICENGDIAIIDYKFGDGVPVKAEGNDQLQFYATAAAFDLDLKDFTGDAENFHLYIIQPNNREEPEYTRWDRTREDLANFAVYVQKQVAVALGDNPPLKTGSHCRWCKAKVGCPILQKSLAVIQEAHPPAVQPDDLAAMLDHAKKAELVIAEVRNYAHKALERGEEVPGYKLVNKRANRKWVDEEAATKLLVEELGEKEAFAEPKLLSVAKAEGKIGKKVFKDEKYTDHVIKVSSGTTMVHESDPRDAVGPNAETRLRDRVKTLMLLDPNKLAGFEGEVSDA